MTYKIRTAIIKDIPDYAKYIDLTTDEGIRLFSWIPQHKENDERWIKEYLINEMINNPEEYLYNKC